MKKLFQITLAVVLTAAVGVAQAQDAAAGKKKTDMCMGCHNIPDYQASFPEVHKVPMIAGQNPKYIASALAEYAKGDRKHPTMRSIAGSLTEKDMADVAAYYAAQAQVPAVPDTPPPAPPAVAKLLEKGACISCHGSNFSQPVTGAEPKLAGQHPDYLYAALKAYQTSDNPLIGRNNAIMVGMVQSFSHAELKEIADYLGSLPGEVRTVEESRFADGMKH